MTAIKWRDSRRTPMRCQSKVSAASLFLLSSCTHIDRAQTALGLTQEYESAASLSRGAAPLHTTNGAPPHKGRGQHTADRQADIQVLTSQRKITTKGFNTAPVPARPPQTVQHALMCPSASPPLPASLFTTTVLVKPHSHNRKNAQKCAARRRIGEDKSEGGARERSEVRGREEGEASESAGGSPNLGSAAASLLFLPSIPSTLAPPTRDW